MRERLLTAANDLFYAEGVHTVGIDRVIERAGVAKASLYGTFGSKEELVRAYLEQRGHRRRERILSRIAKCEGARERVLGVFDALAEIARETSFRGCAFVNACAEGAVSPSSPARQVSSEQRAWVRDLFVRLATELGASDPAQLGRRLSVLYDGATITAWMDSDPDAAMVARQIAESLLDAQLATKSSGKETARKGRLRNNRA